MISKPALSVTLTIGKKAALPVTVGPRKPALLATKTGTFSDENRHFQ